MNLRACSLFLCALTLVNAESAAGLKWTAPAGWKAQAGTRPMRVATYTADDAECVAYFFGEGQGGSIDANMERWKNQFHGPAAKIGKRTIHGLQITTIDASGDYTGMGETAKPGYRLLGAIVEGPGGNIFFKFTGPSKTIAANQEKFESLLGSITK
jgi:hypothetical protein